MSQTISSILDEMKTVIESNDTRSPNWWLENAMRLAVLRQDLQAEITKAEIIFRNEVVILTSQEVSYNKAENMVKGRPLREGEKMTSYQWYNYLKGRDKVVQEIIMIAKKQSSINEFNS